MSMFQTADEISQYFERMANDHGAPGWDGFDAPPAESNLTEAALAMVMQVMAEVGQPPAYASHLPNGKWEVIYYDGDLRALETSVGPDGWEYAWIADERDPDSIVERTGLAAEEMPAIVARFVARLPAP